MSLKTRVAKMESRLGRSRTPSESEFQDAMKLKHRHFKALLWPQIYPIAEPSDPAEVALMRFVEESGQIVAARDIEIRYWRARGVDIEARERKTLEEMTAALNAAFGEA